MEPLRAGIQLSSDCCHVNAVICKLLLECGNAVRLVVFSLESGQLADFELKVQSLLTVHIQTAFVRASLAIC